MEICLWAVIGILCLVIFFLLGKLYLLRKSAEEIEEAFADRLVTDTNALIDISSGDKRMRRLADSINVELRKLRKERLRFEQGDSELKNAVTNISHDLRTPLTAIFGYLDLLKQEPLSETEKRYVEIIGERAEVMRQLTGELFRYSVLITSEEGHGEDVVVNDVLEESIAAYYAALKERGIAPEVSLPRQKVIRHLDPTALSRVFSNLLNNAIKYSDGDLEIRLTEDGDILFSNQASGLNEIQVGKLFDRFYTVEAARKSTGLGLAIAKTLTEQMGGRINAGYENGRLSILIRLPQTTCKNF